MTDAALAFLPWLRRGAATEITRSDGPPASTAVPRAEVTVGITFNTGGDKREAQARLPLFGSGDVTGIDPRVVIRVWPRTGAYDATSNYFPLIELAQADLPWRYTPARDSSGRLRPWMCLITLKDGEYEEGDQPTARNPVAWITVKNGTPVPNLAQAWAWAHVQVSGVSSLSQTDAQKLLNEDPTRLLARLLSSRRLEPRTQQEIAARYTAFLVPTFERGRLAGLGEPVTDAVDALEPAWSVDTAGKLAADRKIPIYYRWDFTTGGAEDFEELVRKLEKKAVTEGGKRDMDVRDPGLGRGRAASSPLGVEGALRAPAVASSPWPISDQLTWVADLKPLVDSVTAGTAGNTSAGTFGPPLYGRWHARRDSLQPPPSGLTEDIVLADVSPAVIAFVRDALELSSRLQPAAVWPWFDEANADPRLRVVAALGTFVVQQHQEQLIASAWKQVEGIRELNAELRRAQAAREVAKRVYERHLAAADVETLVRLTSPVHGRIRMTDQSPYALPRELLETRIRPGVLAPQLRRVARRMGPIGRRLGLLLEPTPSTMLARLNSGALRIGAPPRTPSELAVMVDLPAVSGGALASGPGPRPGFRAQEFAPDDFDGWVTAPEAPSETGTDDRSAIALRTAVSNGSAKLTVTDPPPEPLPSVNLRSLRARLLAQLDPERTIADVYKARAKVDAVLGWKADTLDQVMAAPTFPQPMFERLRELSQEWIFPGLDKVPPNSMSVLRENRPFINAYMLGLNYEMARELLWHGYPTDQRGTYFKQFWDPGAYFPQPGQTLKPGDLEDIEPITSWRGDAELAKVGKKGQSAEGRLVLLIRGDLLRRYPNLTIYAVKAKKRSGAPDAKLPQDREPSTAPSDEKQPLFGGTLKPDVSFFAFDLTERQALGKVSGHEGGWYFVLQEQPSEPRFGLDVSAAQTVTTWDDLAWPDLGGTVGVGYIDVVNNAPRSGRSPSSPGTVTWPSSGSGGAADVAYIAFQPQVRVAVHATDLIEA